MADNNSTQATPQPTPRVQLLRMMTASWLSQAIYAAAKLELADRLAGGPQHPDELAQAADADPKAVYRLLRALAGFGIFVEDEAGRFSLTPMGELLGSDRPDSVRSLAVMMGEELYQAWGSLLYSVRTGQPAFEQVFGKTLFDYLKSTPESGATFDACMGTIHGAESDSVVAAYDFDSCRTVVDVGGGVGSLLQAVLRSCPDVRGVLFDLPEVIERAQESVTTAGLDGRCELVSGSFFDSVPAGGDIYLLRHVIHDWDDEKAANVLRNCRQAMPDHGRLLVVETIIPPGNEPGVGKVLDLNMLVVVGGQERTRAEFESLFASAGLHLKQIIPTSVPRLSILEAVVSADQQAAKAPK
jgi:hypothetical protein